MQYYVMQTLKYRMCNSIVFIPKKPPEDDTYESRNM